MDLLSSPLAMCLFASSVISEVHFDGFAEKGEEEEQGIVTVAE